MCSNAAMAAPGLTVPVVTGTALKTMLQVQASSTKQLRIVEWGISFDAAVAATPIRVELGRNNGPATVTAHVAANIVKWSDPNAPASSVTLSTTATGYTSSGEGSPNTTLPFDIQLISPTGQYVKQWAPPLAPLVAVSATVAIRVLAAAAVNAYCYMIWDE